MTKEQGFSLVELMIALVLGLLVGGAVLQSFVMNNRSIVFQRAAITTQDQGRVALEQLSRFIRMAGYQEIDLASGSLANGLSGSSSVPSVTVRYQAGGAMSSQLFDCLGFPISSGATSSGAISINEFKLVSDGNDMNNLVCQSSHELDGTTTYMGEGVLARNIEQLQVLYGVDTDNDQAPNRYLSSNTATMSDVVAAKVCLVIASDDNMISLDTTFNDFCITGTAAVTDKRIRRKVSSTITLRNRIAGDS
ncbi:MAG: PilW family protein [Motiliproteus sp.]